MNRESKEDFTDTWWFLGICATVTIVLTICAF
ncbi:cytochrome c biogenesis protein ResB [Lysinibacillus parviboronicapiens]|uniref:Cytochrome c biogenesis protein ResB n=1 Tax=Lysinibacillus parviboronicapiens TaxID=436516 RepID=A0ABV2PK52_9BACI